MSARRLFLTSDESRVFLQAWLAAEILFAAWAFAITWHPDDGRSMILFVALAACYLPLQMQLMRLAVRRGRRFGFLSPSLQWELMLFGPYEALRLEGVSKTRSIVAEAALAVLPLVTAAIGAGV